MGERTNGGIWKLSGAKNFGQISQRSKMLEEFGRSQNVPKLAKCSSTSTSSSQVRCPGAEVCLLHWAAVQFSAALQCKQRRCSSILQLAQKWLKQESNVFIAHTAAPRRFMEKKSTHSMINSCPEILTHNKSLALHGSIGQTPKMAKPPEIYPSQYKNCPTLRSVFYVLFT